MSTFSMFWRRLLFLLRRNQFDQEMQEEMQFHLEMKIEENLAAGMTAEEARYQAMRQFGNRTVIRERSKDIWSFIYLETLAQDVRYAVRMLRQHLAFTAVVVLALGLGIGANTAIFSVINSVLLQPLPYREPDKLVMLSRAPINRDRKGQLTDKTFLDWRDNMQSFEEIAGWNYENSGVNLTNGAEPERVATREVSINLFDTLGVKPHVGRTFIPSEFQPGQINVAVIGYGVWQRQFGGKSDLIGQSIILNGKNFTVIGVAPPGFDFPGDSELWIPFAFGDDRILQGQGIILQVIGRLKPDVSLDQARAEMKLFSEQIRQADPELAGVPIDRSIIVTPLLEHTVKSIKPALLILFGAVGFVLLIACANVANLLLSRSAARQKELAIRADRGAGRLRLIRQLLVESLLLALLGGGLGLLLAIWGIDGLVALSPAELPRVKEIGIDRWVLGFTLLISVVTGLVFGLFPAMRASKLNLNESLQETCPKATASRSQRRVGSLLVSTEIALAVILLIGSGLLIRSFHQVMQIDPGFRPENVITVSLSLPESTYPTAQQKATFFQQVVERVRSIPGVESAAATNALPIGRSVLYGMPYTIEGQSPTGGGPDSLLATSAITSDYFHSVSIPLLIGREITDQDTRQAPAVAVINEAMARRYWPNESPIGKRITILLEKDPREIIAVVGNTRQFGLEQDGLMEAYVPYQQARGSLTTLVIRASHAPLSLVSAIRNEVQSLDKNLPLYDVQTMEQRFSAGVAKRRFTLILLTTFAAVALILTVIGIYGMLSYSVTQRYHEIGIRMALGARRREILRLILTHTVRMLSAGVLVGIAGAIAATRLLTSLLFGVSATDSTTYVGICLILAAVALLASLIPARRATKIDPIVALRYE